MIFSGRNRNNLHGDLHKRVRHEDRGVWLCFTSKRLPKVCHITSYETNNISPALKEFLNDVDFRNTWNILDFTIVMIGLVFNLLLSPQQSEYSIKLAPIQFLKNYENLFSSVSSRPFLRFCKFRLTNHPPICSNLKILSEHLYLPIQGLNVKSLRAFRVLRPLRLLSSIPSENPS